MSDQADSEYRFIDKLKKLDGAIEYDGSCSSQVIFRLANGRTLRISRTDDDVAVTPGLHCDQYEGLALIGGDGKPTTDLAGRELAAEVKQVLQPFKHIAKGIPDNWPEDCVLRFDYNPEDKGYFTISYYGRNEVKDGITIKQWRALSKLLS